MSLARSAGRFAQITFVVGAALALGWLSIKTAAIRVLPATSPLLAMIAPTLPEATLQNAIVSVQSGHGTFDDRTYAAVLAAAEAWPLDERPFFLVALNALAHGDQARGRALLEEARRRNPRFRIARILLLDQWLRAGDVKNAAPEMTVLARILPGAQSVLVSELARLSINAQTSATTRQALSEDPALLNSVLSAMSRQGASPGEVVRFAGPTAPAGLEAGGWRRVLIDTLIAHGDYAAARSVWSDVAHVAVTDRAAPIFDAALIGRPAPPPFNWNFTGNEVGVATIGKGVMNVEFYGRVTGELASQLLVLAPGAYRLRVTMEGLDGGDGSGLSWTLTCAGTGGASLLRTPPIVIKPSLRTILAPFTIPRANCDAQWLKLVGAAGEFASPVSARVRAIAIERQP